MLTKRKKQILDYIKKQIKQHDYSPTLEELAKHFKLAISTIHQHIDELKRDGYLDKLDNQPRTIQISKNKKSLDLMEIPLLGLIAAGQPIETYENKEIITVPKSEIGTGKHYALKVQGDSMIDEGIFDGDTIIIREQPTAEDGETIVAIIDENEATLKKLYREKNGFRLQPANQTMLPIYRKEVEIRGVVIRIIRNLENKKDKNTIDKINDNTLTYISLFSGGGVGCHGFSLENFQCIATVEIIKRRLEIQKYNNKCKYETGYIANDLRIKKTKEKIFSEIKLWENEQNIKGVDIIIATPPCQGMSVANHKKKNELNRNSLVVESIKLTKEINPKFFIFENVRAFLNTLCTDLDGKDKKIKKAIEINLAGQYNIEYRILNFKDYGNLSSRTRTLVIGVRKDLTNITPLELMPERKETKTLKGVIGNLKSLKDMGEIDKKDIYHNFRPYSKNMLKWIKDIKQGESAFDNIDPKKRPHKIVNGKIVYNQNKNGDKYKRCLWNKIAPCIHTRNDILASQSTIHPTDNRVFSIRELMKVMTIPDSFKWTRIPMAGLNNLSKEEKRKFLTKNEINIRQCIGEAIPTTIFKHIAYNIKKAVSQKQLGDKEIKYIIKKNNLINNKNLIEFIKKNIYNYNFTDLSKIAELTNSEREKNAAYYTNKDMCFSIIRDLPDSSHFKKLYILEPSVGTGNFLPLLIKKYENVDNVVIDVVDIDKNSLILLGLLLKKIEIPNNIKINFIHNDFLLHRFNKKYDIVIGNPPFGNAQYEKEFLNTYKKTLYNANTNNIFSYFLEKSLKLGNIITFIAPKSILSSPEFNRTRDLIENYNIKKIIDYGEKGFKGIKIETVSLIIENKKFSEKRNNIVKIESWIKDKIYYQNQNYIFDKKFPYWLIYRNDFFDQVTNKLQLGVFKVFRDRQITKKITKNSGKTRVIKSKNIISNGVKNITGYDSYLDSVEKLSVSKFLNKKVVIVPNLSYNPRATFLPLNSIVDGSAAILILNNNKIKITKEKLAYFNTDKFNNFYRIARNYGTRSLNIDTNSVFFWGLIKK